MLTVSDNINSELQYEYQINEGNWQNGGKINTGVNMITVSGLTKGMNTIKIRVKDLAGNTAKKTVNIFKL